MLRYYGDKQNVSVKKKPMVVKLEMALGTIYFLTRFKFKT